MRRQAKKELEQPYPNTTPIPERFADAIGVGLSTVRDLHRHVLADFDETSHGIGWWAPHPGASRRILISDHLLMCIGSIETNLIEARLHLLELQDFDEQEDGFIAHAVKHDAKGQPSVKMPPREKAADDLPHHMAALHIAGFFRAIGSTVDCLGASIIGALALPTSLLKADMDRALNVLAKVKVPTTDGAKLQASFGAHLTALIASSGPGGWLRWTTDYRNMLVHRGRRLQLALLDRRGALLHAPDGIPIMLARSVRQLAQDPGLSDIESLLSMATDAPVLTEDAVTTLEGVMASTRRFAETTATALLDIWTKRRSAPGLLLQPKEQWPGGASLVSTGFRGYKVGSVPFNANALVSDDTFARRLKAAALDDRSRKMWETFD